MTIRRPLPSNAPLIRTLPDQGNVLSGLHCASQPFSTAHSQPTKYASPGFAPASPAVPSKKVSQDGDDHVQVHRRSTTAPATTSPATTSPATQSPSFASQPFASQPFAPTTAASPLSNYGANQTIFAVGTFSAMLRSKFQIAVPVRSFKYATELLEIVEPDNSGCLVVDAQLPDRTGVDLHRQLIALDCDLSTIVVSQNDASYLARSAFRSGVIDVLSGDLAINEIASVLIEALRTNAFRHGRRKLRRVRQLRIDKLTARELDVAKLLSKGFTLKEVGSQLNISVQTASKHRSNIFSKLRVSNEVELHKTLTGCLDSAEQHSQPNSLPSFTVGSTSS